MANFIRAMIVGWLLINAGSMANCQTPDVTGQLQPSPKFATVGRLTETFRKTIAKSITFDATFVKPKLGPYLERLCDEADVTLLINQVPFKRSRGDGKPDDLAIDAIGKGKFKVSDALEHVMVQLDAVLIPRRDYFEVMPREMAIEEALGVEQTKNYVALRDKQPKATIARQEMTVRNALSSLEAASKRQFKLDQRTERHDILIEVAVTNQPVDTAAIMIAKLAGLTIVKVDDVSVFTTKELAGSLMPR